LQIIKKNPNLFIAWKNNSLYQTSSQSQIEGQRRTENSYDFLNEVYTNRERINNSLDNFDLLDYFLNQSIVPPTEKSL